MYTSARTRHDCAHFVTTLAFAVMVMSGLLNLHAPGLAEANILLADPVHGTFTTDSQAIAHGRVEMEGLTDVVVTVNGEAVTLDAEGSFTHPVPLDAERIFNPVLVELTSSGNTITRRRPVVIAGASLPEKALAPESGAARLTDRGIDQLEMLISRFIDLDVAEFLPPGRLFSDRVCTRVPPFGVRVCGDVHVTIDNNPAPRLGAVEIDLDAQPNQMALALALRDLFVRAEVEADVGPFSASCTITVDTDVMRVNGALRLEPSPADARDIDVTQAGDMTIAFGNFDDDTDCGGFLGDIVEGLIKALVGDIQELMQDGLSDFLNTPNAAGNTPLAEVLEDVLGMISLDNMINAAIAESGLQAHIPFARISEDNSGITFVVDSGVEARPGAACATSEDNPALAAVYDVPQPLPTLDSVTPAGQPFDAGGVVSTTILNQALRGATACGLLQAEFTGIDINGNSAPITAGLIGAFLPAFDQLDPSQPIRAVLHPTLAPVSSGAPGPAGELVDLRVSAYLVELFIPGETSPLLQLALDFRAGLDLLLDPATGALQPRIGDLADWSATLVINPLGVDPARIDFFIEQLLPEIDSLNNDIEPLEIPGIAGLDFEVIEISRIDNHVGVFFDMTVTP